MDIKNTLEVITLGASMGKAFAGAKDDGKIGIEDLGQLIQIIPALGPALADISQVPAELKDIDSAELEQIKAAVIDVVGDVAGDKAIEIAKASLDLGLAAYDLMRAIK